MKYLLLGSLLGLSLFAAVDINHASIKELQSVKGIGEKKAQQIVAYRETHCFQSIDEITKIKGIGEKSLEKMRSDLTLTPCK
ncbi:helix-hairpin-helix domain-containing protein [Hydrogenimonas sp.]|uniref:ComEA family DNA-binding protein n=1 Tax=Hydrogenimonas sp. TaxID=2231112 RepID=UPI00260D95D2|nr:helix-hairpin-helix domain-containing protein [Hydrogenimonas sp.]